MPKQYFCNKLKIHLPLKIIIFGASGSGTTTLATALAKDLGYLHLDADEYYWAKTPIPYEVKKDKTLRNQQMREDFEAAKKVIVSGGIINWESYWLAAFDWAIFLKIPPAIRMQRLQQRELERYGDLLQTDKHFKNKSAEFLEWARQYDNENFDGKNITRHQNWIQAISCPTLVIAGDTTTEERLLLVKKYIYKLP